VSNILPMSLSLFPGPQNTNLNLLWTGVSGVTYQVQSSTNLIDWQSYGGLVEGSNGTMNVDLPLGTEPQLFFRLAPAK
jgi:hypothetical protein